MPYGMDTATFTPNVPVTPSGAAPRVIVRQRADYVAVLDYGVVSRSSRPRAEVVIPRLTQTGHDLIGQQCELVRRPMQTLIAVVGLGTL